MEMPDNSVLPGTRAAVPLPPMPALRGDAYCSSSSSTALSARAPYNTVSGSI